MPEFDMSGKVALVTGGSRGIGKAIALGLAKAGADVVLASRTLSELEKAAEEISHLGRRSLPIVADVSSKDNVDNLVSKTLAKFDRIDILVNDAAIKPSSSMLDVTEGAWDQTMAVNLKGCFLMCQSVGQSMVKRRAGNIINIASAIGTRPGPPDSGVYSISKAGVIMLTRVLAKEWGQYGIRVNAIAPGVTKTDMVRRMLDDPQALSQYLQKTALGRINQPEDIVGVALLLASDESSCVTGQVIVVDAGALI